MENVLFCVDGGVLIGLGHLQRCRTLALEFRARGVGVAFAGVHLDAKAREWLVNHELPLEKLPDWEPETVLSAAKRVAAGRAVVDTYRIGNSSLEGMIQGGLRTLVIDDWCNRGQPATWFTNSSVLLEWKACCDFGGASLLLGPAYALVREAFTTVARGTTRNLANQILVTCGGADPGSLATRVLSALESIETRLHVRLVIGLLAANEEECRALAARSRHGIEISTGVHDLSPLMRWADMAISAAGQTLFELAATGTPTVAVQVADNQDLNCRLFEEKALARVLWMNTDSAALRDAIADLHGDPAVREEMTRRGREAVDGRGAARLVSAME